MQIIEWAVSSCLFNPMLAFFLVGRTKSLVVVVKNGKVRLRNPLVVDFVRRLGRKTLYKDGDESTGLTLKPERPKGKENPEKVTVRDYGEYIIIRGLKDGVYELLLGYDSLVFIPTRKAVVRKNMRVVHSTLVLDGSIIRDVKASDDTRVITTRIDGNKTVLSLVKGTYEVGEKRVGDTAVYTIKMVGTIQRVRVKLLGFECEADECDVAFVTNPKIKLEGQVKRVIIPRGGLYDDLLKSNLRVKSVNATMVGYVVQFEDAEERLREFTLRVKRGKYVVSYDPEVKAMFIVRASQS